MKFGLDCIPWFRRKPKKYNARRMNLFIHVDNATGKAGWWRLWR